MRSATPTPRDLILGANPQGETYEICVYRLVCMNMCIVYRDLYAFSCVFILPCFSKCLSAVLIVAS